MKEIDTSNDFLVGRHGDFIVLLRSPMPRLTMGQAIRLAGWLVAMACETDEDRVKFVETLNAIEAT